MRHLIQNRKIYIWKRRIVDKTGISKELKKIETLKLSDTQIESCGTETADSDLYSIIKSVINNEPPCKETIWDLLTYSFISG